MLRRRSKSRKDVGLTEDGLNAKFDQAEFARELVVSAYPREQHLFEEVLAAFETDPGRAVAGHRLQPPVGMGVDLALMTPYVLSVVSLLAGAAMDRVVDGAVGSLDHATRKRLHELLKQPRQDLAGEEGGEAPSDEAVSVPDPVGALRGTSGESARSPYDGGVALSRPLEPDQEHAVHALILEWGGTLDLAEDKAQHLAEAVIGALRARAGIAG